MNARRRSVIVPTRGGRRSGEYKDRFFDECHVTNYVLNSAWTLGSTRDA